MKAAIQAFALPRRILLFALGVIIIGATLLFLLRTIAGAPAAQSAYLGVLLLIAPSQQLPSRWRLLAGAWAVGVSMLGFVVGPSGLWAVAIGLVAVSLVQGLFRMGAVSSMTGSPANFAVFANMATSNADAHLWQVAVGSLVGVGAVLIASLVIKSAQTEPIVVLPVRERLQYGTLLAAGSLTIILLAEYFKFPYASWALLSFCLILAVEPTHRKKRAWHRVVGTAAGALLATTVTLFAEPIPTIVAVICGFLCVAYIRAGKYALFMTFLTPSILLTSSSAHAAYALGAERVAAIAVSAILAITYSWVADILSQRSSRIRPAKS